MQRDEIHVEWQLRELRSVFHRLPPKDDSYRSPNWEPCLPVDLPSFLAELLARQIQHQPRQRCACAGQHGGSGYYVFVGPDGGHCRRSNYARRIFRPACDGRYHPGPGQPARLVIADAAAWPGVPVATWPSAPPASGAFIPPRGRGIQAIPEGTPLTCWLPVKFGLTPHGLRHSHRTWMEMSRVASDATFGGSRERALPAVQRATLGQAPDCGSLCTQRDLGCHHPVAPNRTMMQPVRLHQIPG